MSKHSLFYFIVINRHFSYIISLRDTLTLSVCLRVLLLSIAKWFPSLHIKKRQDVTAKSRFRTTRWNIWSQMIVTSVLLLPRYFQKKKYAPNRQFKATFFFSENLQRKAWITYSMVGAAVEEQAADERTSIQPRLCPRTTAPCSNPKRGARGARVREAGPGTSRWGCSRTRSGTRPAAALAAASPLWPKALRRPQNVRRRLPSHPRLIGNWKKPKSETPPPPPRFDLSSPRSNPVGIRIQEERVMNAAK